jgi:hypothetical protein
MSSLVPTKACKRCGDVKSLSKFDKFKKKDKVGIRNVCRKCNRWKPPKGYFKKYYDTVTKKAKAKYRNSEHGKRKILEYTYKKRHNITLEYYDIMFEKQNGVCALCKFPEIGKRLAVDHNHQTGKIRGLLCQSCNCLLGLVEKKNVSFKILLEYLGIEQSL